MKNRMLEKIIKKTKIFGSALLLATAINCGESDYDVHESIINNISYTSDSHENSLNHWFVTGEDINVYVSLNEGVDSAYINAERRFRDNTVRETYPMVKEIGNNYMGVIPAFDDGGILRFNVVVNQGEKIERSSGKEEAIFISENDFHSVVKDFCDERNKSWDNCSYTIDEIIDYGDIVVRADVNFKMVEGFLYDNAIIEYVGENDVYEFSLDEREYLINNGVDHKYIYNLLYLGYYWGEFSINEVTNKQELENYVSTFYYGLLY